jgi:hypothetical protein
MSNEPEKNIKNTDTVLNNIEKSLWTAVRILEQRKMLLNSVHHHSGSIRKEVEEADLHISLLKNVLKNIS